MVEKPRRKCGGAIAIKMNDKILNNFVTSHTMETHPLLNVKKKTKIRYYIALEHFVHRYGGDSEYENIRLSQYRGIFFESELPLEPDDKNPDKNIRLAINDRIRPWTWKNRFWLMCDIALITGNMDSIKKTQAEMEKHLSSRQKLLLGSLVLTLSTDLPIPDKLLFVESLIYQIRRNYKFLQQPEMRIMVTANMSAGKSTLINALVGRPVARMAQESCTSNLSYIFNKPFEDKTVHLLASPLNLDASEEELMSTDQTDSSHVALYFKALVQSKRRLCLIDTPGVNSTMDIDQRNLTYKALLDEKYDKLIYILNANKLGTDEEISYLKYIYKNVPENKIIFVLNKLDTFNRNEDSIELSIEGVRNDLIVIGYENPIICPISAYFSMLLKKKVYRQYMDEDEEDLYNLYEKKFNRPSYDLSDYYEKTDESTSLSEIGSSAIGIKCGLYGLEKILYGGNDE